jgi:hypothetical protein
MQVRDKTKPKDTYKGRPFDASDKACPCRPCCNPHDCGRRNTIGKWLENMECATRWNNGCPFPKPKPEHIFTPYGKVCKRCGTRR